MVFTSGGTEVCGVKISGGDYQCSVTGVRIRSRRSETTQTRDARWWDEDSSVYVSQYDIIRII